MDTIIRDDALRFKVPRRDAYACNVIRQLDPEELTQVSQRYGHRTLKKLLMSSDLFDIEEEPTPKGGTRTIYRINPRFELQIQGMPLSD